MFNIKKWDEILGEDELYGDGTRGCPKFVGVHSMNFSDFRTLQNCQIACPKYLVCRKKILERKLRRSQNSFCCKGDVNK